MAAGNTTFADISARVNDIIDDSLAVARMANVLAPTVTNKSATGMFVRKVNEYNAVTFAETGENDVTSPQVFSKDALASLTPKIYTSAVLITDARADSDFDGETAGASKEFGAASARHVDSAIAGLFSSSTGGTVGLAGTVLTWKHVTAAYARLVDQGVPAGAPVFCALHPFQWHRLLSAATLAGATVSVSPMFQDRMTSAPNFFNVPSFQGITFVITNAITIDGSTDAYGCLYVPEAFAIDTRRAFDIEPERKPDVGGGATQLNASMIYASGVWRSSFAVAILSDAATPDYNT